MKTELLIVVRLRPTFDPRNTRASSAMRVGHERHVT